MGLYLMTFGRIEIGYEVGELNWHHDVDKPAKQHTEHYSFIFLILYLCFRVLQILYIND